MLAFRTELILSLFLTVSSLSRFFPPRAQNELDDNEEMISSAYSSLDSSGLDPGPVSNLLEAAPRLIAAGFPLRHSPRIPPLRLEAASHQWSTFLGLQRRRGNPSKGAGHPLGSLARSAPPADDLSTRRRPADRARVPASALPGANWKNEGGLQIGKTIAYGATAPAFIKREHFQTRQKTQGLQAEKKIVHERPSRQHAFDLPNRQVTDDGAWGSGEGSTDNLQTIAKATAKSWHLPALSIKHDAQTRQKTAEEAWRRLIKKGSGVTEEIVLPLTEHEATRSNCRSVPFAQNISHPNCKTFTVQNHLCFGQCSSFFIPGPQQKLYRSCSRCFPSQLRKATILLECEEDLVVSKDVTLVEECKCDLEKEQPLEN